MRKIQIFTVMVALACGVPAQAAGPSTSVVIDDSEARAAVAILSDERAGRTPGDDAWKRLFDSTGYRRLKQREAEFKVPFTDHDFRAFLSDPKEIAMGAALGVALSDWKSKDLSTMEERARAYLPSNAALRATVYLLIKPRRNSFVYQLDTDPAIMLYVDPSQTADQFSNTVSHELTHIGDAENCPPAAAAEAEKSYTPQQKAFNEWLSAFGEGWAVLAAAGGPGVDPHWEDPQHDRDLWNAQMATFPSDFDDLQAFFRKIFDGTLHGDAVTTKGMTYFGDYQGPWYTVGYRMDVTIEKQLGRPTLVSALCDKRQYLAIYNQAAEMANRSARSSCCGAISEQLPLWSSDLVDFLEPAHPHDDPPQTSSPQKIRPSSS